MSEPDILAEHRRKFQRLMMEEQIAELRSMRRTEYFLYFCAAVSVGCAAIGFFTK